MADKSTLIGNDGAVYLGERGSAIAGGGADDLDTLAGNGDVGSGAGIYQIAAMAATGSVFSWSDAEVGDYFWDDGTLVLATDDEVYALPTVEDATIKGWQISPSKSKVDTGVFKDKQKTYRMGKADMSGSVTGLMTADDFTLSDRFVERMTTASDGSKTKNAIKDDPFYVVLWLKHKAKSGEKRLAMVGRVEAENFEFSVQEDSADEFTCNIAPTTGDKIMMIEVQTS